MSLSKTLLTAITLMASASTINAQTCKFDVDKTDGVSKMHIRSVKYNIGGPSSHWVVAMEQKGPKYYMTFELFSPEKLDGVFEKGQEIMLMHETGRPYVIFNPATVAPKHTPAGTSWIVKTEVTPADLEAINAKPVKNVEVSFMYRSFSSPQLTAAETRTIQQTAACLMN